MQRRRYTEARRHKYCEDHEAIVQALSARNPALASDPMKFHLIKMRRNFFGDIDVR
jgi:DNA-binding FadR family transcriptional regulator